jgi:hypothetical protein
MPRWLWWAPLGLLTLWAAVHFFRMGWIALRMTETDVINSFATRYLESRHRDGTAAGARATDCVAYPGEDRGIWLVISCGPTPYDPHRHYEYNVNRFGGLEYGSGPGSGRAFPLDMRPEI